MPTVISKRVVVDRLNWVEKMLEDIRSLPLDDKEAFLLDRRNVWTAESCLRRALEALFDLGRHILARGFGEGVSEYKEVALRLGEHGVLSAEDAALLRTLAGYRNRLVRLYHPVGAEELYEICALDLADVERVADAYRKWIVSHPEHLDDAL